jgi:hypothetical protein
MTDFKEDKDHDNKFDYRQVIGKLLHLEKSTRPDISHDGPFCQIYLTGTRMPCFFTHGYPRT